MFSPHSRHCTFTLQQRCPAAFITAGSNYIYCDTYIIVHCPPRGLPFFAHLNCKLLVSPLQRPWVGFWASMGVYTKKCHQRQQSILNYARPVARQALLFLSRYSHTLLPDVTIRKTLKTFLKLVANSFLLFLHDCKSLVQHGDSHCDFSTKLNPSKNRQFLRVECSDVYYMSLDVPCMGNMCIEPFDSQTRAFLGHIPPHVMDLRQPLINKRIDWFSGLHALSWSVVLQQGVPSGRLEEGA